MPTMPAHGLQLNKRPSPAIRLYSGSQFGGKDQKVKVVKASQISEQKRQLDERRKKKEELRKYFLITTIENIIDLFSTGLTALMRQKITEAGMTANQEPDIIDWEIVPDTSYPDDPMDVDSHSNDWEDVFEDDLGAEGQTIGQRHTRLQAIITCILSFFPCHHVSLIAS